MNILTDLATRTLEGLEERLYPRGLGDVGIGVDAAMRDAVEDAASHGYDLNFLPTGKMTIDIDEDRDIFGITFYNGTGNRRAGNIYVSGDLCRKMPALGRYVLRHEIMAEAKEFEENGAPDTERHAYLERDRVLKYLKNFDREAHVAGIALHYIRNKTNPEPFKAISNYIDAEVAEYATGTLAGTFWNYVKRIQKSIENNYIAGNEDNMPEYGDWDFRQMQIDDDMKIGYDSLETKNMVEFMKYFEAGKELAMNPRNYIAQKLDDLSNRFTAGRYN